MAGEIIKIHLGRVGLEVISVQKMILSYSKNVSVLAVHVD